MQNKQMELPNGGDRVASGTDKDQEPEDVRLLLREALRFRGLSLEGAGRELQADFELVLEAVRENGMALQYAAAELRTSRSLVLEAIGNCPSALQWAAAELRANRDVVLEAVLSSPSAFQWAAEGLQQDHSLIMRAAEQHGLQLFSVEWPDDSGGFQRWKAQIASQIGVVEDLARTLDGEDAQQLLKLLGLHESCYLLEISFLSGQSCLVLANRSMTAMEVKHKALSQMECSRDDISMRLVIRDVDIIDENTPLPPHLIPQSAICQATLVYDADADSVLCLARATCELALMRLPAPEATDADHIVKRAVEINGLALRWASERLRGHAEVVTVAVDQNGLALEWASHECKSNIDIVMRAVGQNWRSLQFASAALQDHDTVVMFALKQHGCALQFASANLRDTYEMVTLATCNSGSALQFASERLRKDRLLIGAAQETIALGLL